MNFERIFSSKKQEVVNSAIDFCTFILRYNSHINHADFTEDLDLLEKIKRGELYRVWGDIEDLGNNHESLSKNFSDHEKTVAKAFQELYNHIEKVKSQLNNKIMENKNENIRINNAIDRISYDKTMKPSDANTQARSEFGKAQESVKSNDFQQELDQIERFINEKVIRRIELLENHEDDITKKLQTYGMLSIRSYNFISKSLTTCFLKLSFLLISALVIFIFYDLT